jgi:FkbM family methyltransferase
MPRIPDPMGPGRSSAFLRTSLPLLASYSKPPLIKSVLFEFFRLPGVNALLRCCRPLLASLDMRTVDKFPVRGPMAIRFEGREVFVMQSDGRDSAASGAFWVGLDAYEGCTLRVFAHLARQSRHIVDVGANTGLFTLLAATVNPQATVHAFEPFPPALDLLEANLRSNRLDNVRLHRAALSDQPGLMPLHFNEALRLTQGASLQARADRVHQLEVPVVRLDDFLAAEGIGTLDLLKIDVEGYEPQVLRGAEQAITRDKPEIICEVIRPEHHAFLRDFLRRQGYAAYRLAADGLYSDDALTETGPVAWNRLFIHPARRERLQGLGVPIHSA